MTVDFYNEYHLGDNVFHLTFLRKLTRLVDDNFSYYVRGEYLPELRKHIVGFEDRITLGSLEQKPPLAINAWIGEIYYQTQNKLLYDEFYVMWFNRLTRNLYSKEFNINFISDYEPLGKTVEGYDIIVINSVPMSNQFGLDDHLMGLVVKQLNEKYRVITTKKVEGVRCTLDQGMSLLDIGAVASNSDNLIAVNTGPITTCINAWAVSRIKSWIVGDVNHTYSFGAVTHARNMNDLLVAITGKYL